MKRILKLVAVSTLLISVTQSCNKEGCKDEDAMNYNSQVTKDDGSCKYETIPVTEEKDLVTKTEYELYASDFIGSNGSYTYSIDSEEISDEDAVVLEWQCGPCFQFDSLPRTWQGFFTVGYYRSSNSVVVSVNLENQTQDLTDPQNVDYFNGSVIRMYVIHSE